MDLKRRAFLASALLGAGYVGLRAIATGLPVSVLRAGPRAFASGVEAICDKAQYVILSTSINGDPLNANCPGSYTDPAIVHPDPAATQTPLIAAAPLLLGKRQHTAARVWGTLPQTVLDRTCFWHLMTNTPVHPKEQDVLKLNGATAPAEMLPSLLAAQLAPCLGTLQAEPISVGASGPSEGLSYQGRPLAIVPPRALQALLTAGSDPHKLQALRDQTLAQITDVFRVQATKAQRAFLDDMTASQQEVRAISQDRLATLAGITGNTVTDQIVAAIVLIQLNVAPVITIHIPFGGDNHNDPLLTKEAIETVSGVQAIGSLMGQLQAAGLQDKVTVMSLNVFGRTLGPGNNTPGNTNGRQHNPNHQVSIAIGKPFKGGVIGGVVKLGGTRDFAASAVDSASGAASEAGDIAAIDTLASFGKTVMTAVGADPVTITTGKVVAGALA